MKIFLEVLKLISVILLPGGVTIGVYFADKKIKYLSNVNKYVKQVVIGLIFAVTTMLPFYIGMNYMTTFNFNYPVKGSLGPILASPIISSMIFGWPAGLTTGIVASLWRCFAVDIKVVDYLRIGDSISIIVASLIGIFIYKVILKKRIVPKWTYGIVLGLISVCIYLLITFPIITFKYQDIDCAHEIINGTDWILFLSTIICISLAFLWLNIYNKQKIKIFHRETKLHGSIQRRITAFFALGLVVTFTATAIVSVMKSYGDAESDLKVTCQDVVNEIVDTTETQGLVKSDIVESIVANRRIRTNGFVIIASAKDQNILKPSNVNNNDVPGYKEVAIEKDAIVAVPNRHYGCIGEKMYFDNNPSKTAEKYITTTVKFKNKDSKDVTCSASYLYECDILNYNTNKLVRYLATIVKTQPLKGEGTNEFYVCSLLTLDEAVDAIILSMRISMYFEILIYSIVYILIYRLIKKKVADNIDSVNSSLAKISEGNLNTVVNVRDYDEFSSLSDDINTTVDTLKGYIADAKKRIEVELQYAKNIQMNSIPMVFPISNDFDLYAKLITAKEVGGDFYDFISLNNNHFMFMIADVSGKGIPAAMFMMRAKALIKTLATTNEMNLDQIVSIVNYELNEENESGMFVTAWFGDLNLETGELKYVNAGHTHPVIKTNKDIYMLQMKPNAVLGVIPNVKYEEESIMLNPNDQIIIYTDGVTEATNSKKELYGEKRLLSFIKNKQLNTSFEVISELEKELMEFQKDVEQADDITMLSLIYKPKKKN